MTALPSSILRDPPGEVRRRCARVAERARHVCIDAAALEAYARELPLAEIAAAEVTTRPELGDDAAARALFVVCLDAINFGSGWFPQLIKLPGRSGYRTVEARVRAWFETHGAPDARTLAGFDAARMTALLGQESAGPDVPGLMELFARAWRDLGELLEHRHGGRIEGLIEAAGGSAVALVRLLLEMPLYRDVARYGQLDVPFLKRAQISAADLAAAGLARFDDLHRLTLFADNLVPHVLRLDGVLVLEPALVERIEREELLGAGSPEEVEIRACAVDAVERIRAALGARGAGVRSSDLDAWLWSRGGGPRYKARPRHRARSVYY